METIVTSKPVKTEAQTENYYTIPVAKIKFSPLNYRRFYNQQALEDFANQVAISGILSPIIVRIAKGNRYELVAGERRLRAAQMAGLQTVPACIHELTDDEVREIQLVENLQRENPHPLHEAQAILLMQQSGKTLEEVAHKLGKPKTFIYNRLKLAELIEPLQEVFFADKLSLNEATSLGSLSPDAQEDFFANHCEGWKEDKHFSLGNAKYLIGQYKYDLKKAPFNIRDKKLLPDVGACTGCPFNSASLKTLFPELAKEAVCNNKTCFKNKCLASAEIKIRAILENYQPEGIIVSYNISEESKILIDSLPETVDLPRYGQYDVQVLTEPAEPKKEDYISFDKEKGKDVLMRERYRAALQEYRDDLAAYRLQLSSNEIRKGLFLRNADIAFIYYNSDKRSGNNFNEKQVTAKEVQRAIKENIVTEEILNGEIERLKNREIRAKELDREKVQEKIHEQFCESLDGGNLKTELTKADIVGFRFIVYQGLTYHNRRNVEKILFPKGYKDNADFFEKLAALSNEQFVFLTRSVISGNGESKNPNLMYGHCLYKIAEDAGMDITAVETEQAMKTKQREQRFKERVKEMRDRIKKLST